MTRAQGRSRRSDVRHDGLLGAVEPDRRSRRRVQATDVTNASRTMFMDLETLQWDDDILAAFGVPKSMLPEIRSSSEVYGIASGHCRPSTKVWRRIPTAPVTS